MEVDVAVAAEGDFFVADGVIVGLVLPGVSVLPIGSVPPTVGRGIAVFVGEGVGVSFGMDVPKMLEGDSAVMDGMAAESVLGGSVDVSLQGQR